MNTRAMIFALLLSSISAAAVLAHGGTTHVMGTISAVDATDVVVIDQQGKAISIALTNDTKYERSGAPAAVSALRTGDRVVIDVTEMQQRLTATQVHLAPKLPMRSHHDAAPHQSASDQPHDH